ncbi:MAG: ABC transporter substrate-binding protein [Clostridia bacterium]|nr:ABC transporter substrate-binding protein [Clostridia bacterium]
MLIRKAAAILLMCTVLAGSSAACSKEKDNKDKGYQASEKAVLTLYKTDSDMVNTVAVKKYKEKYPDRTINVTSFSIDNEFSDRLISELFSGKGPDIIVSSAENFPSIHKAMESGILMDLNELISKDESFKLSDYNEKVMDSGVYKGKRYFIPISYSLDIIGAVDYMLDKNNVKIEGDSLTWYSVLEIIRKRNMNKQGKANYIFNDRVTLNQLVKNCGESLIDFEEKKTRFNSPEFIQMLNTYKSVFKPETVTGDVINKNQDVSFSYTTFGKATLENLVLFADPYEMQQSGRYVECLESINNFVEGRAKVYPYPTYNSKRESYVIQPIIVAVNSKCKFTKEAFDYIKLLLSDEIQNYSGIRIQVNKQAYKNIKEKPRFGGSTKIKYSNIINQLDKIIEDTEKYEVWDREIHKIVDEKLDEFSRGGKSAEQTAKELDEIIVQYLKD